MPRDSYLGGRRRATQVWVATVHSWPTFMRRRDRTEDCRLDFPIRSRLMKTRSQIIETRLKPADVRALIRDAQAWLDAAPHESEGDVMRFLSTEGAERYGRLKQAGKVDVLYSDTGLTGSAGVKHVVELAGEAQPRVMSTADFETLLEELDNG